MSSAAEGRFRVGTPPLATRALRPAPPALSAAALVDNPILWKHIRSRLRVQHLVPALVVVVVLCATMVWAGYALDGLRSGGAFTALVYLQGAILLLGGTSQVTNTMSQVRDSGVLDFHRVSPLPPSWVALGFLLGAPIREYAMFAVTVPFAAFCALASGIPSPFGMASIFCFLLLSTLMFHALAVLAGLVSRRARSAGGLAIGVVVLAHITANIAVVTPVMTPAFLTAVPVLKAAMGDELGRPPAPPNRFRPAPPPPLPMPAPTFYGVPLGAAGLSFIYQAPVLVFLLVAAVRKMRSERAPVYSKPQAVAFLAVLAALAMGGLGELRDPRVRAGPDPSLIAVIMVLYTLFIAGLLLVNPATPSASDIANGRRRAAKLGLPRLSPWNDLSPNYSAVAAFCLVLLLSAVAAVSLSGGRPGTIEFWSTTFVAILALAHFGLARQYFELAFGRKAAPFFLLFLFLAWLVPLLIGAVFALAGAGTTLAPPVMSLSPFVGIAAAAFPDDALQRGVAGGSFNLNQFVALASAAGLTLIFGILSFQAQRSTQMDTHAVAEEA